MLRIFVMALLTTAGSAYAADDQFDRAKQLVAERLTDPASAQFRRLVHIGLEGKIICGEVNARNRLGGYDGFRVFAVSLVPMPPTVSLKGDAGFDGIFVEGVCVPLIAQQAPK